MMKHTEKMLGGMADDKEHPLAGNMAVMVLEMDEMDIKANDDNREIVVTEWNYGPEDVTGDNAPYWKKMARLWMVDIGEAKRQRCGNCQYFDNAPECIEMMEAVPEDDYDKDGGGRGYCKKFDFVAQGVRVCQAWEDHSEHED